MRAAILRQFGDPGTSLAVGEMEIPQPKPGQVVVKIAAAPVNPADGGFVRGFYVKKPLPTVPGLEGAGTVVAANAGPIGESLMGKRVACFAPSDGPGPWAEYMACDASVCFPLEEHVTAEMGATLLVNPLTAIGLVERARGSKSIVQTAAGSALGRMIHRHAEASGLAVINVVRRGDAAAKLKAEGRTHVLDSSAATFETELQGLARELGATTAVDAVAGEITALLLRAMPHGSKAVIYGGLSGAEPRMGAGDAIIHAKSIEGFWIPLFVRASGPERLKQLVATVQRGMPDIFGTDILDRLPLERVHDALTLLATRGSDGKVLLVP